MAHGQQLECGGIVFDLEKAFNTLPRLVCLGLAQLIGLDGGTLRAWSGALGCMTRAFEVEEVERSNDAEGRVVSGFLG